MRKRTGLRKPKNIRQAEWDSHPEWLKERILLRRRETEERAALMGNPADFVKGIVAAEGGLPMDIASILAPGGGMSHAQRLTQMRPGGHSGYKEQEFVPEYKGTTLDLYSKMGGDPTSGAGLFGEFMAPGAIFAAPIAGIRGISKGIKALSRGNKALNRIFKGTPDPIFANQGMEETAQLLSNLKAEGQFGDIFISRDKLTGMINSTNPEKRIYNKQIREYSGFDKWLNDYKNKHAKGKKRHTTISLNDLKKFWDENNLDLREKYTPLYADSYSLPGGNNQRSYIMTYHGKNPPMSLETSNNLDQLAQKMHQKSFDELEYYEQESLENIYTDHYPEDINAQMGSKLKTQALGHFDPNTIFHLRMDDRKGIGKQIGEKHLNVFELQSDWYAAANKSGAWNFEVLDDEIYELQRRNAILEQEIANMRTPEGRPKAADEKSIEIDDNKVEIKNLQKMRESLEDQKKTFDRDLASDNVYAVESTYKMPFISPRQNEKWMELALKKIVKKAIDDGYDRVTFGSYEVHKKLYPSYVNRIDTMKIRREPASKEFPIKRVQINKEKMKKKYGSPENIVTPVTGKEYPYHIELFDLRGNKIRSDKAGVEHYTEEGLTRQFGEKAADLIRKKAKIKGKTILNQEDFGQLDIGLEHIKVLYENVLPGIIKGKKGTGIFKKLGLKVEKVPMGNNNILDTTPVNRLTPGEEGELALIGNQVAETFSNNPTVINARETLQEMGIQTAWHNEPPYVSFAVGGGEGDTPTQIWRGFDAFDYALLDGINGQFSDDLQNTARHYAGVINNRLGPGLGTPNAPIVQPELEASLRIAGFETHIPGDGLGERLFSTTAEFEGIHGNPDLQDVYSNSAEFARALEDARLPQQQTENMLEVLENMRQMEIQDRLAEYSTQADNINFDEGYKALMHPESRQTELNHEIAELNNNFGISALHDENNIEAPRFIINDDDAFEWEGISDEQLWANAKSSDELADYMRALTEEENIPEAILSNQQTIALAKRIEIVGHPSVRGNENVLDITEKNWGQDYMLSDIPTEIPTGGPLTPTIDPADLDLIPTPETNYQEVAHWPNQTYDMMPEDIQVSLHDLNSGETALRDNYNIEVHYPSMSEDPYFTIPSVGPPYTQIDAEHIAEAAHDLLEIPGEFMGGLQDEVSNFIVAHDRFRERMSNLDFANLYNISNKSNKPELFMLNSIKLTDENGNLLEKLKPFKDGGKFYYGALPPGILAGEAARQQEQQQSLLDENIW